jgi:hypothetical protein
LWGFLLAASFRDGEERWRGKGVVEEAGGVDEDEKLVRGPRTR